MLDGAIVAKIHNKLLAGLLGKWPQFFLTLTAFSVPLGRVVEKTLEAVTIDVVILGALLSSSVYLVVPIVSAQVQR